MLDRLTSTWIHLQTCSAERNDRKKKVLRFKNDFTYSTILRYFHLMKREREKLPIIIDVNIMEVNNNTISKERDNMCVSEPIEKYDNTTTKNSLTLIFCRMVGHRILAFIIKSKIEMLRRHPVYLYIEFKSSYSLVDSLPHQHPSNHGDDRSHLDMILFYFPIIVVSNDIEDSLGFVVAEPAISLSYQPHY